MTRLPIYFFSLLAIALSLTLIGSGCGKKETPPASDGKGPIAEKKESKEDKNPAVPASKKMVLKAGDGVITGKVVFDGTPPECVPNPALMKTQHCDAPAGKEFENCDQKWIVGKDKAVANVLVVLQAPSGYKFAPGEAPKEPAVITQPYCAFVPHVVSVKPGQELIVTNTAKVLHDTKVRGNGDDNPAEPGGTIPIGGKASFVINPQKQPLTVSCQNHNWMQGVVWAYDHPYTAVTDLDGTFTIKNVPTGIKLTVSAWHEGATAPFFFSKDVTVAPGATEKVDFSVKPK